MNETATVRDASELVGYDEDFFLWTQQQAVLLRARNDTGADWENLAEEIESLGKSLRRELRSRVRVLIQHLLKWQYQPEEQKGGWWSTIIHQRTELEDLLEENPSFRSTLPDVVARVYPQARNRAFEEMRLISIDQIAPTCPYAVDEILDLDWAPSGVPSTLGRKHSSQGDED